MVWPVAAVLLRDIGGVAQLGEHLLCKQGVIGSIPFTSTTSGIGDQTGQKVEPSVTVLRLALAFRLEIGCSLTNWKK